MESLVANMPGIAARFGLVEVEAAVAAVELQYSLAAQPPMDVSYQNGNTRDVVAAGVAVERHPTHSAHYSSEGLAVVDIHVLV